MAKKPFDRRSGTLKDSKGKVLRAPKDNATETQNFKWWTVPKQNRAASIAATLKFMQMHQGGRTEQMSISTKLLGSSSAANLFGASFSRTSGGSANPSLQRLSYNLCSSVIDTLESKMAKNKVIPTYVTNGGDWKAQKKAKDLTKFTQGLFYKHDVHSKAVEMFSDSGCWGDGFLHPYRCDDDLEIERVLPQEIWVDHVEGAVTDPMTMHRVKIMDRDVARAYFSELEEYIDLVAPTNYQEIGGQGTSADLITVIESWKLPIKKYNEKTEEYEYTGGMHCISIGDGCMDEEYKRDRFPFVHYRYNKRKIGWYGQGAVERLQNIQGELNRCMILKQRSLWMQGSFKVLLENGSKVVSQHLNNEVGAILHYTGTPPQYVTPPATNPELQQWIEYLISVGYQQEGVSRLSTTGEAPLGVDSGKALRTLTQIADDRFMFMGQQLEQATLELASQCIDIVKEIYEEKGSYEVTFQDSHFLETIDWKDIDLDDDEYTIKAFPTNSLSDDLTGRLKDIQELMQAGMVDPLTAKKLLDAPDMEMYESISNAGYDLICKRLEQMLFNGKEWAIEPFNNLMLAKKLSLDYYNWAQLHNCPESKLDLVRNLLAQIDDLTGVTLPPQPQVGAPQANPQAPPVSPMLPNAPGGMQ